MVQSTTAWNATSKITRFLNVLGLFAISFCVFEAHGQASRTTRTKNYTKPIYFDVLGSENQMPAPQLEYNLELNQGRSLQMGPVIIDEKSLSFSRKTLKEIDPRFQDQIRNTPFFIVNWPDFLFPEAKLELLGRDGEVLWTKSLLKKDLQEWQKTVVSALRVNKKSPIASIEWAQSTSSVGMPVENLADGFRFCLSGHRQESFERLCSQRYVLRKVGSQMLLGRLQDLTQPRVLLNGEPAPLKGLIEVSYEAPTRFFAELATGETLEFSSKPLNVKWADIVKIEERKRARIVGFDTPPVGRYQIVNPDRYTRWVETFGFQPTILDSRKFWALAIKTSEPWVYFPGAAGGVFRHPLPLERVPNVHLRLHLDKLTPAGTYRDGVIIRGRKQASTTLQSNQRRIYEDSQEPQEFEWSFQASKNAEINRSSLLLTDGGKTYKAYYELYKGYANELSARASTVISQSGLILMGEASYNHWFEDFMGWDQYYLTKQRWGLSARYFQSFTKIKTGDLGQATIQNTNVDLKYRFTPGLWTRDESHGAMLSYQILDVDVEVTKFHAPMLGVGWFWARSMPKVFDDFLNYAPFLRYPKWVDVEFIYYALSMESRNKLNLNFALNFHGQVLWKKNFFGEAGFGIKRYAFSDQENSYVRNVGYSLNTLYGTVGIGFKF